MIDEQVVKHMLAVGLRYVVDHGFKIKDISVNTGLSQSTVRKLMNEQTEYPRFHTVLVVLEYLGYDATITKKGKSRGIRTEHESHQQTPTRLL